jgi:nucleoside-diphosphate-sugar epimerase
MKIAISGSTGFLGKGLALALTENDHEVLHITRDPTKCRMVFGQDVACLDLNQDDETLLAETKSFEPEVFIHTATHFSRSRDISDLREIMSGTLTNSVRIYELSRHVGASFLNFNSMWQLSLDGNLAGTPYAAAKEAFRTYLRQSNVGDGQLIRDVFIPETFGPGDTRGKIVQILLEAKQNGVTPAIRNPETLIDLVYEPSLTAFFLERLQGIKDLPREFAVISYPAVKISSLSNLILGSSRRELEYILEDSSAPDHGFSYSNELSSVDFPETIRLMSPRIDKALEQCL